MVLSISHELTERVYYSGFISQATGVSLDRLGANSGIYRIQLQLQWLSWSSQENLVTSLMKAYVFNRK